MRRFVLGLTVAVVATPAHADTCGKPDLLTTFPADGAKNVPTNATLSAYYAPTAEYQNESIDFEHVGAGSVTVDGTFDDTEGLLVVIPPEGLVGGDSYAITWPALRGIDTATQGSGEVVHFTTGSGADTVAPTFNGLSHVEWDVERESDACTNDLEDRFAFDLTPGAASDDFGTALLALAIFQTKGPNIDADAPPIPVLTTHLPTTGQSVRVETSISDGTGHVCFAAFVRDLAGATSGGASEEVCATTTPPPFFYGCRVAAHEASSNTSSPAAPIATSVLVLSLLARRRYRRAS